MQALKLEGSTKSSIYAGPTQIGSAAPAVTGASTNCGGCYVVADVAGYVFAEETITQTRTQVEFRGFNATTVSSLLGTARFSIPPSGPFGLGATTFAYDGQPLTVGDAVLYVNFKSI